MSKKIIALLAKSPALAKVCTDIKAETSASAERMKFIEKQIADLQASHEDRVREHWKVLVQTLRDEQALPENYDDKNDTIGFNTEEGSVWLSQGGRGGGPDGGVPPEVMHILKGFFT